MREVVHNNASASPIGPYSQAIKIEGLVFVAGEKGMDPETNQIVQGGVAAETRQTLENVKGILEAAGSSLEKSVATFVFMTDLGDFEEMNGVFAEYFPDAPPGRTTVQVVALPAGAHVEITVFAVA